MAHIRRGMTTRMPPPEQLIISPAPASNHDYYTYRLTLYLFGVVQLTIYSSVTLRLKTGSLLWLSLSLVLSFLPLHVLTQPFTVNAAENW